MDAHRPARDLARHLPQAMLVLALLLLERDDDEERNGQAGEDGRKRSHLAGIGRRALSEDP